MTERASKQLEQAAEALETLTVFSRENKFIYVYMEGVKKAVSFPYLKNNELIQYLAATMLSEIRRVSYHVGKGEKDNAGD